MNPVVRKTSANAATQPNPQKIEYRESLICTLSLKILEGSTLSPASTSKTTNFVKEKIKGKKNTKVTKNQPNIPESPYNPKRKMKLHGPVISYPKNLEESLKASPKEPLVKIETHSTCIVCASQKPDDDQSKVPILTDKEFEEEMIRKALEDEPLQISPVNKEDKNDKTVEGMKEAISEVARKEEPSLNKIAKAALVLIHEKYIKEDVEKIKTKLKIDQSGTQICLIEDEQFDEKFLPKENFLAFEIKRNPLKDPTFIHKKLNAFNRRCFGNCVLVALEQGNEKESLYEERVDYSGFVKEGHFKKRYILQIWPRQGIGKPMPDFIINKVVEEMLKVQQEFI